MNAFEGFDALPPTRGGMADKGQGAGWASPPQVDKDFHRINQLPKKKRLSQEEEIEISARLTEVLRTPHGQQSFFPCQGPALVEIAENGGAYVPIRVSGGKTLISLLAGTVLGAHRILLLVPASLVDKTKRALAMATIHWQVRGLIKIESYSRISQKQGPSLLAKFAPDLIVADECQALSNPSAGVTKAVRAYVRGRPEVKFVALTGTGTKRSILDYAGNCILALRERAPVPLDWYTQQCWAGVLDGRKSAEFDEDGNEATGGDSFDPGALAKFATPAEEAKGLAGIRQAFRRRFRSTPGIVTSSEPPISIPIVGTLYRVTPPAEVLEAVSELRESWCTPDGQEFQEASVMWQHLRQMARGLCYVWDPPAPPKWREKRKAYFRMVRELLASNRRGLFVPSAIKEAILSGDYGPEEERVLAEWTEVEPSFVPVSKPIWISDHAVTWLRDYLAAQPPTLVLVEHGHIADRLVRETRLPYYGERARDAKGRPIIDHVKNNGHSHLIGSLGTCGTGHDLQYLERILFFGTPLTGRQLEQAIGRVHRKGSKANMVEVDWYIGCPEDERALTTCKADAIVARDSLGEEWNVLSIDWAQE